MVQQMPYSLQDSCRKNFCKKKKRSVIMFVGQALVGYEEAWSWRGDNSASSDCFRSIGALPLDHSFKSSFQRQSCMSLELAPMWTVMCKWFCDFYQINGRTLSKVNSLESQIRKKCLL